MFRTPLSRKKLWIAAAWPVRPAAMAAATDLRSLVLGRLSRRRRRRRSGAGLKKEKKKTKPSRTKPSGATMAPLHLECQVSLFVFGSRPAFCWSNCSINRPGLTILSSSRACVDHEEERCPGERTRGGRKKGIWSLARFFFFVFLLPPRKKKTQKKNKTTLTSREPARRRREAQCDPADQEDAVGLVIERKKEES